MEITDKTSKVNIQFDPISVHERKFRWYFGLVSFTVVGRSFISTNKVSSVQCRFRQTVKKLLQIEYNW